MEEEIQQEINEPEPEPEDELILNDRIPFSKEDLINAHLLRSTTFQDDLLNQIDDSLLYESAKRALRILVKNYFNSTWFLANLERGNKESAGNVDEMLSARLRFEIDLIASSSSMMKSDVNSPEMLSITNALRSQFKIAILSRAKGPYRERILNKMQSIENIVTKRDETSQGMYVKKERKGILG